MVEVVATVKRSPISVERSSYLGYPMVLTDDVVSVHSPDGHLLLSGRYSLSTARLVVRRHRRKVKEDNE